VLTTFKTAPGTRRDALGEQLVIGSEIYTPGASRAMGRGQGTCTRGETGAGHVYNCELVLFLPTGNLYLLGIASRGGPESGAVAGGTGRYAGARGTFAYASGPARPRVAVTLKLR
jgi:hypothetical protein